MSAEKYTPGKTVAHQLRRATQSLLIFSCRAHRRAMRTALAEGKIAAQHIHSAARELLRDCDHQWRIRVSAGAVREHEHVGRLRAMQISAHRRLIGSEIFETFRFVRHLSSLAQVET